MTTPYQILKNSNLVTERDTGVYAFNLLCIVTITAFNILA